MLAHWEMGVRGGYGFDASSCEDVQYTLYVRVALQMLGTRNVRDSIMFTSRFHINHDTLWVISLMVYDVGLIAIVHCDFVLSNRIRQDVRNVLHIS